MGLRISSTLKKVIFVLVALIFVGGAWFFRSQWLPPLMGVVDRLTKPNSTTAEGGDPAEEDHDDHDHDEHDHGSAEESVELSAQARKNIGLKVGTVEPRDFERTITVPAVVAEWPGRTHLHVATPMTGVVTHVLAHKGESVTPGRLLFEIRLTHEDLVRAQTEFLQTLGELDVENRELERLRGISEGVIARKTVLQREYQQDRLKALLQAQREALLLHGLTPEQVDSIAKERRLLRKLQVFAPASHDDPGEIRLTNQPIEQAAFHSVESADDHGEAQSHGEAHSDEDAPKSLLVLSLDVHKGQAVSAGDALCVLADFSQLYIEGQAFERDADALVKAANQEWKVTAMREVESGELESISGLKIVYLDNEIDLESRALRFYVALPNEIVRNMRGEDGTRFITWKYKVGQRLQLQVPVEVWKQKIVLPIGAVARDGAEYFVYRQNGKLFERRAVHVVYRDQFSVVVENDGAIYPGDRIAMSGAHQIHMEMKNKAMGGAVDPHAGHSH